MDPEVVLAVVRVRHPRVVCWYGRFTGSYWFLSADRQLVEALDEDELVWLLEVHFRSRVVGPVSGRSGFLRRGVGQSSAFAGRGRRVDVWDASC
ncbi:hypothetical protein EBO15_31450 [Actinomadura harenae]|uniref:Uncharacterized protein n=1 Tax=Actinomadura harenae TaxID=2483351 RepID=A0A3M2LQS3_9ACTN|nr:hypothetical protein EBO15_31450 [Actinomadura harenae]